MKLWPMKRNWESEYDVGGKVYGRHFCAGPRVRNARPGPVVGRQERRTEDARQKRQRLGHHRPTAPQDHPHLLRFHVGPEPHHQQPGGQQGKARIQHQPRR